MAAAVKKSKIPLTRERIVNEALLLAEAIDVESVSFRKLADRLQVTPMALYRYFDDKEALLSEMLNEFIRRSVVLPPMTLVWDEWLRRALLSMFDMLAAQPSWIPLLGQVQLRTGCLEVMDATLQVLSEAGFSREQSVEAFLAFMHGLFGAVLMQYQLGHGLAIYHGELPAEQGRYKSIEAASEAMQAVSARRQVDLSAELLIDGLRQRLEA